MSGAVLAGRYRLGRVLGRGGMGTVYAAHDEVLGRDVAVKVLDLDTADATTTARFTREGRVLASLQHPHIVAVHDFGTDASAAWLVMPQLPGPDLQSLVDQRGPLPVEVAARYGGQAATALAVAHAAGIVHRDVKPANLMLAGDGSVVLLDLGIARLADAATAGGQGPLTRTGLVLGSVPYLAPEVISGAPPGPPADVYALGVVLFALLTGRTPFSADVGTGLAQHLHAPPPSPAALRPDLPVELSRLVLRMLDKDPTTRPTAADVAAVLGAPAGAGSRTAGPATAVLPVIADGHTRVLPVGGPVGPVGPPARARTSHRRPRRTLRPWPAAVAAVLLLALALAAFVLTRPDGPEPGAAADPSPSAPSSSSAPPSSSPPPTPTAESTPPPPPPAPVDDPVGTALTGLETAIGDAARSGELAEDEVGDLYERAEELRRSLQGDEPDADEIDDVEDRLDKLVDREDLTEDAAARLQAALDAVRNAVEQND